MEKRDVNFCYKFMMLPIMLTTISCENSSHTDFESRNRELQSKIDSLENKLASSSYGASIFDAQCGKCYVGDTISFDVGLLFNREGLIDTISLNLFKLDEQTKELVFIKNSTRTSSFSLEETNYLESFELSGLSKGKYLYDGYLYIDEKKVDIQRHFTVNERPR